jgi:hypothetical protein
MRLTSYIVFAEADVYAELLSILRSKDVSGANVRKIYQYFQRWVLISWTCPTPHL